MKQLELKHNYDAQRHEVEKKIKRAKADQLIEKIQAEKDNIAGLDVVANSRNFSEQEILENTKGLSFCKFQDITVSQILSSRFLYVCNFSSKRLICSKNREISLNIILSWVWLCIRHLYQQALRILI